MFISWNPMRNLIALFACSFVMSTASANDPPVAPAAVHGAASEPAKPVSIKAALGPLSAGAGAASAAAAQRNREDTAEAELSAKIAARLAVMRANQAARVSLAAKAAKAAQARRKEEVQAAAAPPPPRHGNHWSYEGENGPANWASINSDWAKCGTGTRQSPIDIRDGMKVELESIVFDYKPSSFNVIDNGHTIQASFGAGNMISIQNHAYELVQLHFHRPSEERINGKGFEMVAHLVHKDVEGKLAVLAVMLERGKANPMIQTIWNNLPLEKNDVVAPLQLLDVGEILPQKREYFTYMGSLTTPPCSEGVLWLVMKEPMSAAPAQMALFSRLYPLNARPLQPSSGRVIKESN
jgi:carbonic anhydrase